jgi:hypothetical protein
MNGNEGYWGGGISIISQNFSKSPSILFHPLDSSISQTNPNLSLPPFHPLAHVAVTLDPRKPYHSLTRPRPPYPCFLPRVRLYVATTTTKQSVTPPHNRCTVSKCGVGGNAGGWINYNVLIPLCLYGSCIKRLKVPMSCSLKIL